MASPRILMLDLSRPLDAAEGSLFSWNEGSALFVEGAPIRLPAPDPAAVEAMLASSYGIFKGAPIGTASLRFYDGAARGVRAQTWHPEQKIEETTLPSGEYRLDLHLPVHDWTEILQRALQAGAFCEVLSPPEFRERWRTAIQAMSARAGLG